eukprot:g9101.t1
MPSLCIASGAPVGGGTASAACAPSNAINLPGGKVAQHVKGLRLVPVALASGAAASRPARRRLALRSRGGERQERSAPAEEEGDFLAGFRLALGSREELLQQELLKAEEDLARLRHQLDKIEKEKESLEDILGSLNREAGAPGPSEELENEEEPEAQEDSEDAAPPPRVAVLTSRSQAEAEPAEELEGCRCLRRGGLCTCREDARWLRSKRAQLTKYAPPHTRRAVLQPATPDAASSTCRCLRRHGCCSCQEDERWLQRKRRCVETYVPPHLKEKERQRELEQKRQEIAQKAEAPEAPEATPNIRTLARRWEPHLEGKSFGFNPLQLEGKIVCDDLGLEAECRESLLRSQGVKALPLVQWGNYHFEVELLRDCRLAVGWSSAMSHCTSWDMQAFGYTSEAQVVHQNELSDYGLAFGKAGDIVGSLVEWKAAGQVAVSFMLNGRDLGEAFQPGLECWWQRLLPYFLLSNQPADHRSGGLSSWWRSHDERSINFTFAGGHVRASDLLSAEGRPGENGRSAAQSAVPLQPQVTQLASGLPLMLRLRGTEHSGVAPLAFPKAGFRPLAEASSEDFCPFSRGVAEASTERTAALITEEHLEGFAVPDDHVVELYDLEGPRSNGATTLRLTQQLVEALSLPRFRKVPLPWWHFGGLPTLTNSWKVAPVAPASAAWHGTWDRPRLPLAKGFASGATPPPRRLPRCVLEARKTRNADKEALAQLERAVVTAEAQRQEMKERLTKNESSHQEASETQKKQWSMELESEQALRAESEHRWEMLSEELQRQKEELQEEYRRLQAAYHALEEHLDSDLEEALAESKRKATEAVEQVTALEDEKKQLKEEMNSMALKAQKELGEMRGELEKAATLKLEQVEKDLEEAQAGLRDQEALAAEEANLLQEAQEETTKLKEQLMKLEVDRIALEQQFQEDVKKVESEFKSKMFAAEEEAKQAKAGQSKLEGQISALRKEVPALKLFAPCSRCVPWGQILLVKCR